MSEYGASVRIRKRTQTKRYTPNEESSVDAKTGDNSRTLDKNLEGKSLPTKNALISEEGTPESSESGNESQKEEQRVTLGPDGQTTSSSTGIELFRHLCDNNLRFEHVETFATNYKNESQVVGTSLLNFLFHCFGFPEPVIHADDIFQDLEIQILLDKEHQKLAKIKNGNHLDKNEKRTANDVLRISTSPPIDGKHSMKYFPSNFKLFWHYFAKVVSSCESWAAASDDDDESALLSYVVQWLIGASAHQERQYRLTSTTGAFHLITGFAKVLNEETKRKEKVKSQMNAARKKMNQQQNRSHLATAKKRLGDLEKMMGAMDAKIVQIRSVVEELFAHIYVHRHRDIADEIRTESAETYGDWLTFIPVEFMEGTTTVSPSPRLQLLASLLYDLAPKVRQATLKSLKCLYKERDYGPSNITETEPGGYLSFSSPLYKGTVAFTSRYFTRFVDMTRDKDERVAIEASKLLLLVVKSAPYAESVSNEVEGACFKKLSSLCFADHAVIRRGVASVLSQMDDDLGNSPQDAGSTEAISELETDLVDRKKDMLSILFALFESNNVSSTHAGHIVDAFWNVQSIFVIRDLEFLAETLLSEDSTFNDNELNITVSMFVEVAKKHAGAKDLHSPESSLSTLNQSLSQNLLKYLPQLLNRFQADESKISILGSLPALLNLEKTATNRNAKVFKTLLQQMHVLFLQHGAIKFSGDGKILSRSVGTASSSLASFGEDDENTNGLNLDQTAPVPTLIHNVLEEEENGGKNVLNTLAKSFSHLSSPSHLQRDAQTSLRKLCDELCSRISENFGAIEIRNEFHGEESIYALAFDLERLAALYMQIDLIDHVSMDLFESLNTTIASLIRGGIPTYYSQLSILSTCLRLLFSRLSFRLLALVQKCKKRVQVENSSAETGDDSDQRDEMNRENPVLVITDEQCEPLASMRDELVPYLMEIMKFRNTPSALESPKIYSELQWGLILDAFKIFCDICTLFKAALKNTELRILSWNPSPDMIHAGSEAFISLYQHRSSPKFTDCADDASPLDPISKKELVQLDLVNEVISPYVKFALRNICIDECDVFSTAVILVETRNNTRGRVGDMVKVLLNQVKQLKRGFALYFDVHKTALVRMYENTMNPEHPKPKRNKMMAEMTAFSKELASRLKFSLISEWHRNCVVEFVADGVLYALNESSKSHYLGSLRAYLVLLKPTHLKKIIKLVQGRCYAEHLSDPWFDSNDFQDSFKSVRSFQDYLHAKTGEYLAINKGVQVVAVGGRSIDLQSSKRSLTVANHNDQPGISGGNPLQNPNSSKRDRSTFSGSDNHVAHQQDSRLLSDLSSSDSENDFETSFSQPSISYSHLRGTKIVNTPPSSASDHGSGSESEISIISSSNRPEIRSSVFRNSKIRTQRLSTQHYQSEVSIIEVDEDDESEGSELDEDSYIVHQTADIMEGASKRQRLG